MNVAQKPLQRTLALWVLLISTTLVVAACGGAAPAPAPAPTEAPATEAPTDAPAAEPTDAPAADTGGDTDSFLVFGNSGEPDTLDSMDTTTGTSLYVTQQMLETLVTFAPGTLDLEPGLATEWTANEDSTEWTFTLREGVTFHDGTPFNAEAVVFNFRRIAEEDFEFGFRDEGKVYAIFPDIFGGYAGSEDTIWRGVEAVDDTTVVFTLNTPTPLFPNFLAADYFAISSPTAVQELGADYGTPNGGAVGTGPFRFLEWRPGESISMERYEDYWGEPARMPGVTVRFIDDAAQRLAELQAGAVDFTVNLAPDARETIANDPNLAVPPLEPFNIAYLSLNINNPPLDNPLVRQAIAHAIDKEAILEGLYGGVGTVAVDFLPDALAWARADDLNAYEYDPERARELLAEAGFPDGFSTMQLPDGSEVPLQLWYMPVSRPYYPDPQPVAELFSAFLADVGIEVELQTEDWGVYLDNWDAGTKYGMVMLGWTGDYADPNNFLRTHFGPGTVKEAGYDNQEVFDLLDEAGVAASQEEAAALFKQAGTLINADLPRIPIVHAPPVYGQRADLEGWVPSPSGGEPFAPIFIPR